VDTGTSSSDGESSSSGGGAPLTGEELFLESCSPCHGVEGEGTMLAYAIQHPLRDYSRWVVRNGRPQGTKFPGAVMLPFGEDKLADAELELIFDYLDSFPQPADGQGLFMDYCRNCHGVDAAGGVVQTDIRDELDEARIAAQRADVVQVLCQLRYREAGMDGAVADLVQQHSALVRAALQPGCQMMAALLGARQDRPVAERTRRRLSRRGPGIDRLHRLLDPPLRHPMHQAANLTPSARRGLFW